MSASRPAGIPPFAVVGRRGFVDAAADPLLPLPQGPAAFARRVEMVFPIGECGVAPGPAFLPHLGHPLGQAGAAIAGPLPQIRQALEWRPEEPAEQVAAQEEIRAPRRFLEHRGGPLTVREVVRGVARLGGFLGRKHDGDPGVQTLWRGYQRLQDLLLGYQLRGSPRGKDVGNR